MKTRIGFVSNSSSSSFVLLFEKDKEDVVFSKNDNKSYFSVASLLFLIENSDESKIKCKGFYEYVEKLRCSCYSEDCIQRQIAKIEKEIKDNIELVCIDVENGEASIIKIIENLEECDQVKTFIHYED